MKVEVVEGDLLAQDVDVIVNSWNRNIIPWWLLLPQGVAGEIRRQAGTAPFRELAGKGAIPVGGAVMTGSGRLSFKAIIHVAGINMFWIATEHSIRQSVRSAVALAQDHGYKRIAMPLIGAGVGGGGEDKVITIISEELEQLTFDGTVIVVRYRAGHGE